MTTPIEMPTPLPVNAKSFDLAYVQNVSPVGLGYIQTIERAPPMWVAKYTTPPLSDARDQSMQAFLDSLDGSMNPFLAFDARRPRPYAYMPKQGFAFGSTPWQNGATKPTVTAVSNVNSTLTCGSFKIGAIITAGDYIAFFQSPAWYLFRATAGVVANGSGVAVIPVKPRPNFTLAGTVNLRLEYPCAAMKLIGSVQKNDTVEDVGPSYVFNAGQFIDRSA